MAQGIRTINGYTNNYPTKTSSNNNNAWPIGTGIWNTTYMNTHATGPSTVTITIPAYTVTDGTQEIRICFRAGTSWSGFTATLDGTFTNQFGFSDLSFTAGKYYEISILALNASTITCVCKEWS